MTGFEELKTAYEMIKNEYGYICESISENEVIYTVSQLFAITGFVKIIQDNRDNKDVIDEFIKHLRKDIS